MIPVWSSDEGAHPRARGQRGALSLEGDIRGSGKWIFAFTVRLVGRVAPLRPGGVMACVPTP